MRYDRWHVYEKMKRTWRETNRIMTAKEVSKAFPGTKAIELMEGMIEFEIAIETTLKYEHEQRMQYLKDTGA